MPDYKFRNNKYNTRNYVTVLEKLIPGFYIDEELSVSGVEQDPFEEISHSLVGIANKSRQYFGLSSFENSEITKTIANPSSFAKYFVKQNKLTDFDIVDFDTEILAPLGYYLNDFNSSAEFSSFVSDTLLPSIRNGNPDIVEDTRGQYGATLEATQDHLLEKMGWFYILNMTSPGNDYQPWTYVHKKLVEVVYQGEKLTTADGVVGAANFIWRNTETSSVFGGIFPDVYLSGTDTWTSGTQQLDKLETLLRILISDKAIDESDTFVRDTLDDYYLYNSSSFTVTETPKGPLYKFLRAMSWSIADTTNDVSLLSDLYNPDTCTDEMVVRMADVIGLELFGFNPDRWRLQLKNAVGMYRKSGTLTGLKAGIDSIYGPDAFDVSSSLSELYESYVPDLILYALLTESPFYVPPGNNLNRQIAWRSGVKNYSTSGLEENARIAVDYLLAELYLKHPHFFTVGSKKAFEPYRFQTVPKGQAGASDEFDTVTADSRPYCYIHANLTKEYTFLPIPEREDPVAAEFNYNMVYDYAKSWGYTENQINDSIQNGPDGYGFYIQGSFTDVEDYGSAALGYQGEGPGSANTPPNTSYAPERFLLDVKGDQSFVFNYRGHENGFPLPPFERRVYYSSNDLDSSFLTTLGSLLEVFEVSPSFVSDLKSYITEQALNSVDTSGVEKAFSRTLFFTTAKHNPPNYDRILELPDTLVKYVSLWNSKSSHFIVDLKAQSFDFAKRGITSDGAQAPANVGRVTKEISPAKAIPLVVLDASVVDLEFFYNTDFPYNDTAMEDGVLTDSITQGRNLSRSFRKAGFHTRDGFNMPITYHPSSIETSMPSSLGFVPLGRLPGGGAYFPIRNQAQVHNLPDVYRASSTTESDVVYQGNPLSNTFPCRGASGVASDAKNLDIASIHDKYQDRSELQGIQAVMHRLWDRLADAKAEFYVRDTVSNSVSALDSYAWNLRSRWQNVAKSYANSAIHTESFAAMSGSSVDFDNFEFAPQLLELYNYYITLFGGHDLGKMILRKAEAGIFSQTFGPLLYNADLSIEGSAVKTNPYLQASAFQARDVFRIEKNSGSGIFSVSGTTNWQTELVLGTDQAKLPVPISGTLQPYSTNDLAEVKEFRNAVFCSGIQLIDASGSSDKNNFQLFNKPQSLLSSDHRAKYTGGNTMIKVKAENGIPRIRFDLKNFGNLSDGNKLIPSHDFHVAVSALIAEESGRTLGGGSIGVWIHTGVIENSAGQNFFWSWVPDALRNETTASKKGSWYPTRVNSLSRDTVLTGEPGRPSLATVFNLDEEMLSEANEGSLIPYGGLSGLGPAGSIDYPNSLNLIEKGFFKQLFLEFDTKEGNVIQSDLVSDPIHTEHRDYYVEIIFVPRSNNSTKYMLFDQINMRDDTLHQASRMSAGVPSDPSQPFRPEINEKFINISKEELWTIIRYLKQNTEGMSGANFTRGQTTRSRGLWIHPLVTSNHATTSAPSGTVFTN
tara:strand:- start:2822 stop:7231 length:4410 start_codon:yes stop_codon:yes gene_type:complete